MMYLKRGKRSRFVFFRFCLKALILSVCFLFLPLFSEAAIRDTLSYQAKITDINLLAPVDANYNMEFRIYDAVSGGNLLWTETWNAGNQVPLEDGVFTVELNSICASWTGACASNGGVDWSSDSLYLEMAFDADANGSFEEVFAPRRRFAAVPYAQMAARLNTEDDILFIDNADHGIYWDEINDRTLRVENNDATAVANLSVEGQLQIGSFTAAPTALGDGSMYYDTTDNKFYMRENGLWLAVASDGNAFIWDADTDTGIQVEESADDDTIRFDLGGLSPAGDALLMNQTNGLVWNDNGLTSLDFRLEGDNDENLFFVDASADKIGLGTNVPDAFFELTPGLASALRLNSYGVSAGNTSQLEFMELVANGSNYVGFKAPDNIASSVSWVLPNADGSANYILTTDGAGTLSWSGASSIVSHSNLTDTDTDGHPYSAIALDSSRQVGSPTTVLTLDKAYDYMWSAGLYSGFELTDNGDGTVNIAAGEGVLRTGATTTSPLQLITVSGINNLALTNNATNYIYVDYNAGAPVISIGTSTAEFNCLDKCILYRASRKDNEIHYINMMSNNVDANRSYRRKDFEMGRIDVGSGAKVSEVGTRYLAITAGSYWSILSNLTSDAVDTSISDTFSLYYRNGSGGWVKTTGNTQIDNQYYDDGSGTLATLTNSRYGTRFVFMTVSESGSDPVVVMGRYDHKSIEDAENEEVPGDLPPEVDAVGAILSMVIVEKNASNFSSILNVEETTFKTALPSTHNNLSGLQGGIAGEYYHFTLAQHTNLAGFSDALTLPSSDGTADQILKTNGSGILSWANSTSLSALQDAYETGATVALASGEGDMVITTDEDSTFADFQINHETSGYYLQTDAANDRLLLGDGTTVAVIVPGSNDTVDLGSSTTRFQALYLGPNTLHIGANGDESQISYNTTSDLLKFQNSVDSTTAFQFLDADGGTPIFNIDGTNERLGIGTSVPESKLQVSGGGLCVGSDANCNTDNDTEGVIYSSSTAMTAYDLAEMYPTKDSTLMPGEVVALDMLNGVFVKRAEEGDTRLLGVVSTEPGVILGGFAGNQFEEEHQIALALKGRIPTNVSTENGPIEVGDLLSLSSQPGVACLAIAGEQSIGYALEGYEGDGVGSIQVFVELESSTGGVNNKIYEELYEENQSLKKALDDVRSSLMEQIDGLRREIDNLRVK